MVNGTVTILAMELADLLSLAKVMPGITCLIYVQILYVCDISNQSLDVQLLWKIYAQLLAGFKFESMIMNMYF